MGVGVGVCVGVGVGVVWVWMSGSVFGVRACVCMYVRMLCGVCESHYATDHIHSHTHTHT